MIRSAGLGGVAFDGAAFDRAAFGRAVFDTAVFDTVLVANRGEIACRIVRTLRRLGIRSVAVYSDADRDAPHVAAADVAVRIGPAPAAESYLDIAAIIRAASSAGAQAVHPGYGFLSENAAFARACAAAGLVFIGPDAGAIELMGDKIRAKRHVALHGVPVIEGVADPALGDEELAAAGLAIGLPLLVKPAAGGGGKGMETVVAAADLPGAITAARRIALAAFGDGTLLIERLLEQPRHIEVQVLADAHGAVVHLGERECSLQRRHQKVIEESPAPGLDDAARARLGSAACSIAASVGYRGAGTVEFLVSALRPDEFFFMEMNTRLQVEHPVTEQVTGLDLVEWQLRIAAGEPLAFSQQDIVPRGHSIEARVYAEDPLHGFVPQSGTVLRLELPEGEAVRVDSGIAEGQAVGTAYDPLLAKVIAWGGDRRMALARLDHALGRAVILGVQTNLGFLRELLSDPGVLAGRLDTGLIARLLAEGADGRAAVPDSDGAPDAVSAASGEAIDVAAVAAALREHAIAEARASSPGPAAPGPLWSAPSGWRLGVHRPSRYRFALPNGAVEVEVLGSASDARVLVRGADAAVTDAPVAPAPGRAERSAALREMRAGTAIEVDGRTAACVIAGDGAAVWVHLDGRTWLLRRLNPAEDAVEDMTAVPGRPAGETAAPDVLSPMPGTVSAVHVLAGERVEAGAPLVTVEAMKMEHLLVAAVAGLVSIRVAVGDPVKQGQAVVTITQDPVPPASPMGERT